MISLHDVLDTLTDQWVSIGDFREPAQGDYAATLEQARERSGVEESVGAFDARIGGHRVVIIGGEFAFLAGSIGHSAANRVIAGYVFATEHRLPVVTLPVSGGTRMQEGSAAFARMIDIARAAAQHAATGAIRIGWLRNPTTGGVMATWGSYADITAAEPQALLGFLGPRVYEALYAQPFPPGVQTAENLARVGIIDAVVGLDGLRGWVGGILGTLVADKRDVRVDWPRIDPVDSWTCVETSRDPQRPGPMQVVERLGGVVLSGTGRGEAGGGVHLRLCRIEGRPAVVIANDRTPVTPAGLRVAQRGIALAERVDLPIVTLIDTPGGELSAAAEEAAMAGEIARTLARMASTHVPTVSIVVGQGCGGAALALVPARVRLACEFGWISPLPPEGASVIAHRTPDRADEMARQQGVGSTALLDAGVIDQIIAERAGETVTDFAARIVEHAAAALDWAAS